MSKIPPIRSINDYYHSKHQLHEMGKKRRKPMDTKIQGVVGVIFSHITKYGRTVLKFSIHPVVSADSINKKTRRRAGFFFAKQVF